jgi:4-hydroxy-4-methyl-2-oxoglutarate aldolase
MSTPDPRTRILPAGPAPAPAVIAAAQGLSSATVHEAGGKIGVMPPAIKPVHGHFRVCGPAVTVQCPPGDNLWLHYAILAARPGDVLVVDCGGAHDHGYWGEVMATAAKARHLGGLVIDGGVRDHDLLGEVGFPILARGLCIRGTTKDKGAIGWINAPLIFGSLVVRPGDLVIGDRDGVVVVPSARAPAVVAAAHQRDKEEAAICQRLIAGETTLGIYELG